MLRGRKIVKYFIINQSTFLEYTLCTRCDKQCVGYKRSAIDGLKQLLVLLGKTQCLVRKRSIYKAICNTVSTNECSVALSFLLI